MYVVWRKLKGARGPLFHILGRYFRMTSADVATVCQDNSDGEVLVIQTVTLVVTAILSGVIWLILRRVAGSNRGQVRRWDRDINE